VYIYTTHSKGLFAGAAFEGARLDVDEEGNALFYGDNRNPLGPPAGAVPASVRGFLETLAEVSAEAGRPPSGGPGNRNGGKSSGEGAAEEAIIYPIDEAPR
jgi:hypothetical protein